MKILSTNRIIIPAMLLILVSQLFFVSCSTHEAAGSEKNTYTVAYDPAGGNADKDSDTLQKGEKLKAFPEVTRGNYAFMGWYTDVRGGTQADLEEYNLPVDDSFTLHAKWAPMESYQFDEKWAKENYNNGENNDTVRGSGCGPGVMAIADATINDSGSDIGTACKWSLEHDYFTTENGRTKDGFFEAYGKAHSLEVTRLYDGDLRELKEDDALKYHEEAFEIVKDGNWIVAFMGKGPWTTAGHFVLWYDVSDDGDVFIRDTNSKKPEKAKNKFDLFQKTVIRYWEIQVPDEKKLI